MTKGQDKAVSKLIAWVTKNGPDVQRLTNTRSGDKEAASVNNACNNAFGKRHLRPPGTEGVSKLEAAFIVAGIEYKTKCLRSTSTDDDLEILITLYDEGKTLNEVAMTGGENSRLFSRLKARAGRKSWLEVFLLAREKRPDLDFRRFFRHAPRDVFIDKGRVVRLDTVEAKESFLKVMLTAWGARGGDLTPMGILTAKGEIQRLWKRLEMQGVDVHTVLTGITGVPWEKRPWGYAAMHSTPPGISHPEALASGAEAMIDAVLAESVDGYLLGHQHEVDLSALVDDLVYKGSPYTGKRSPRVDIVHADLFVIEVSFCSEMLSPTYNKRTKWKLDQVERAGFTPLWLHFEDGAEANARKIADVLGADMKLVESAWNKMETRSHAPRATEE